MVAVVLLVLWRIVALAAGLWFGWGVKGRGRLVYRAGVFAPAFDGGGCFV